MATITLEVSECAASHMANCIAKMQACSDSGLEKARDLLMSQASLINDLGPGVHVVLGVSSLLMAEVIDNILTSRHAKDEQSHAQ